MFYRCLRLSCLSVMYLLAVPSGAGQLFSPVEGPPASPLPAQTIDPMGRNTPRGTIREFVRAVDRDDFISAARYMQLSEKQASQSEVLARKLRELLNCCFNQPVATISDTPTGSLEDALPLDRERVGPLRLGGRRIDLILVRTTRSQYGVVWLISSETLNQVPFLYGLIEKTWVERFTPEFLLRHQLLGMPFGYWVAWLGSLGVPLLFFWLLSKLTTVILLTIAKKSVKELVRDWQRRTEWPLILILTVMAHVFSLSPLGFSLRLRMFDNHSSAVILIGLLAWLLRRVVSFSSKRARSIMERRHQTERESLLLLGEKIFNAVVVVAAIFAMLSVAGVDTRTALAGLGIGGIAVAFGAQKTIENLLGGILLVTDKALAVGDECLISNRRGTIEDITLRSVRLRTQEQTLLSIPAGVLSQANIENFFSRRKMLMQTKLRLKYGASATQIRLVRDEVQALIAAHPRTETETAWVRVVNFGDWSVEVDLFVYLLTSDSKEFMEIREELLLRIAHIVESAGCSFAIPSEAVYMEPPPAVVQQKGPRA